MSATTSTQENGRRTRNTPRIFLLLAILAIALALRLYNNNWDDYQHAHPDERWIVMVAGDMHMPHSLTQALDPRQSPFNPLWNPQQNAVRHFAYGHLPLYILTVMAALAHAVGQALAGLGLQGELLRWLVAANTYDGLNLLGRVLSALFDTGSVYLIYLIGRRVYSSRVGLLGASFAALTVTAIQLSHFYAFDPVAAFFIVGAVYGAVRMAQDGNLSASLLAGAMAGAAVSSKFSAIPILAALVVGAAARFWLVTAARRRHASSPRDDAEGTSTSNQLTQAIGLALIALSMAVIVFALTSPFAVIDWTNYRISVIDEQGAMVRGDADFPYTRQYRGTLPFIYNIEQQVRWGMGWPLGVLAFIGLAWVIGRALLGRASPAEWVMLAWCVPYFALTGMFMVKFMRYMLPLLPFFGLMGAALLERIWRGRQPRAMAPPADSDLDSAGLPAGESALSDSSSLPARRRPWWTWAAPALALVVLIGTAVWALAFVNGVYGHEHSWITASRWIYENVPHNSVILAEHWDDTLPKDLQKPAGYFRGAFGYRVNDLPNYEEDTPAKFETIKRMVNEADYIILATNRLYRSIPRLPQRYPMTTRYYDLLFSGQLGFELVQEFPSRPRLGPLEFNDDNADESFTVYDHPKPIVFKKVATLSDADWQARLGNSWEGAVPGFTGGKSALTQLWDRLAGRAASQPAAPKAEGASGKTLLLDRPTEALPAPYDLRWNSLATNSTPIAIVVWWLALMLIQLISWPLAFAVFRHLRDRGYLMARLLGWLLAGWLVWIVASLHLPVVGNNLLTIGVAFVLIALLSLALWRRNRGEMAAFARAHRGLLLTSELVFGAAFLFFVAIRLLNPDLWQPWQGGEKFMEFAFLNATARSAWMPPLDPYYAGGYINYYYYGYFLVGMLIKLTGIAPSVAFNLAVPTLFAATAAGAFSLVYNLAPAAATPGSPRGPFWRQGIGAGLLGSLFVTVLGNLDALGQVLRRLADQSQTPFQSQIPGLQTFVRALSGAAHVISARTPLPAFDWWAPSRILPGTINEFPFWSFLFADLHPHMMGMPFTILFLALALNLVAGYGAGLSGDVAGSFLSFIFIPLTIGALAAINTWDLPTYLGVAILAFLIRDFRATGRIRVWLVLAFAAVVGVLAYGLYQPFFQHYEAVGSSGIGLVKGKTDLGKWLQIWGFFAFLAVTALIVELRRREREQTGPAARSPALVRWLQLIADQWDLAPRVATLHAALVKQAAPAYVAGRLFVALVMAAAVLLALLGYWVPALLLLPLLAAGVLLFRRDATPERTFTVLLLFTGLLVAIGVEFVFLKDFLCGCSADGSTVGDFYRMNTLFKFYTQVWVLLGLGAAAALPTVWAALSQRFSRGWRVVWTSLFTVLLFASLVFPLLGTPRRVDDRFPGARPAIGTLDGMAFMTVGVYTWPDQNNPITLQYDYDAIHWLLDNVKGNPVVAEGRIDYYREGGMRVASFTGLPSLLGAHQGEQRYSFQVGQREADAREFFSTADISRAQQLMQKMAVRYIYIGQLERTVYPPEGIAKFEQMAQQGLLNVPYRNQAVTIYMAPTLNP
ncbi:DUF2298 domain-containing protein [Candidatus Amarolinea aalborgensis]|uniref:DUF2298 domain-containing protein n=1 Tax=Candidatus Amarolinea aalborgensis TaxID=2249329 RepID=UPI003BF940E1